MSPADGGELEVLSMLPRFVNVPPLPPAINVIGPPFDKTFSNPGTVRLNPLPAVPVTATVMAPPLVLTVVSSPKPTVKLC